MLTTGLPFVIAAILVTGDKPTTESSKKDIEKLQGTWRLVHCEAQGVQMRQKQLTTVDGKAHLHGQAMSFSGGMVPSTPITISLDETKEPKQIDGVFEKQFTPNHVLGERFRGIYKVEGDAFVLCYALKDKERPKEFKTVARDGLILIRYERAALEGTNCGPAGR